MTHVVPTNNKSEMTRRRSNSRINGFQRSVVLLKHLEHGVVSLLVQAVDFLQVLRAIALFDARALNQVLQRLHQVHLVCLLQGNRQQLHID